MDYLVFGVGFGSTLVLLGWVLRQFGPSLRYRDTPDEVLGAEQLLERNDWQRFCIAMGALLSVCGAAMLLVTLITLLIRPADRTGAIIVGSIFVISLLAVAAWIVMYVNQHRTLAVDRRADAVAATASRGRAPVRPRPASETPAVATQTTAAVGPTSPKTVAPSVSVDDEVRRRDSTPQPQRMPTESPEVSETVERSAAAPEGPALPTAAVEPKARASAATTPPAPDPTQALRNLHFKRAGTSRREEAEMSSETSLPEASVDGARKVTPEIPDLES